VDKVIRAILAGSTATPPATPPAVPPTALPGELPSVTPARPGLPASHPGIARAAREALALLRSRLGSLGSSSSPDSMAPPAARPSFTRDELLAMAIAATRHVLVASSRPSLRRVINATGIVLHTNLGRARLAPEAVQAAALAGGHASLELSLADGTRRSRQDHVRDLLIALTGAEDALVVNNNAAAVWLAVRGLARGRAVVISRGEMVEIGESFRLPEIMAEAGATLIEVGTTNQTTTRDYRRAFGLGETAPGAPRPIPAAIVLVHPSNYRILGFAARPPRSEVVAVAREAGVPVLEDLGSGALFDLVPWGLGGEPTPGKALSDGVDLVTFSGDKLLGGPQCGVIAGRAAHLSRLREDPVLRCLRPDKMTLAALEATLKLYGGPETDPIQALRRVPVLRALTDSPEIVRRRAVRVLRLIRAGLSAESNGMSAALLPATAEAGGGSLPGVELETWVVALRHKTLSTEELWRRLAAAEPPVVGRRRHDAVLLDMRSVADDEAPELARAVARAVPGAAPGTPPGAPPEGGDPGDRS
jgi:L-seryl-tRNA(Ser) seleniumtransferase